MLRKLRFDANAAGLPRELRRRRLCGREGVRVGGDPEADPAYTDRLELREGSRIFGAEEDIDRCGGDSPNDCGDGGHVRQVRCVEDVSSGFREGCEATDGVIDVGNPPQQVVRTTGMNNPSARSCGSSLDTANRVIEVTNRVGRSPVVSSTPMPARPRTMAMSTVVPTSSGISP